ncbi:hypothetical protein NC652_022342 [Populus alba x Populus x berolinensis]|nr:hypothetical protein NC652_022061 [Populus alba x Populus x berolinensis]KAJ6912028.1 hypothetical protein NC652_022342 [Populus alba x Populus x berolinensis]
MAKSKRKPAAAIKRPQDPLYALVPSYTNQDLPSFPAVIPSSGTGTSTAKEADGSPVDNTNASLDGFIMEDCSDDEDLEEEQLDFSCFEEEYERSPPSSPTLVTLEPPASPKEDKLSVLCGGHYLLYGRPLILHPMSKYFDFSCTEMTHVHVWIKFPNLALKCWTSRCLSKLANRLSYTRVLVEVDLLTDLKSSINVTLPNGKPLIQRVIHETLPKFCKHCKVLGHSTRACSKGKKKGRTVEKVGPASVATKEYVKGSVFSRLNPVVDPLVYASPTTTHVAEVSPIDAPPVNDTKFDVPIALSGTCVA